MHLHDYVILASFLSSVPKEKKRRRKRKGTWTVDVDREERRKRLIGVKTLYHTDIVVACMRVLAYVCERACARVCMD